MLRLAVFLFCCAVMAVGGGWVRTGMGIVLLAVAVLVLVAVAGVLTLMQWPRK